MNFRHRVVNRQCAGSKHCPNLGVQSQSWTEEHGLLDLTIQNDFCIGDLDAEVRPFTFF